MTNSRNDILNIENLLKLDSLNLFAFFSILPGCERLSTELWNKAVDEEEKRLLKNRDNKPKVTDEQDVFTERDFYYVLGDFDYIFTCRTNEFRSFNRIGISDYIRGFQFLYGYEINYGNGFRDNKTSSKEEKPFTAFCEIKVKDYMVSSTTSYTHVSGTSCVTTSYTLSKIL